MQNSIRASRSSPALVSPTSNLWRILRIQELSIPTVYNHKTSGLAGSIEQEKIHIFD